MIKYLVLITIILIIVLFPTKTWEGMNLSLDEPFPGFASNDVGDIRAMYLPGGDTIIWVGTGRGISKTTDGGDNWVFYDRRNGLNQNQISALAVSGTTVWVAIAYDQLVEGELIPYGRGFNKTDDFGETWDSFIPQQVDFAGMIAYDIAIDDTTVWAAAWYGGLIRSQDFGQTWENVFVDSFARKDFEEGYFQHLNNRFFAVVVDTVCPIEKKLKNSINDIAYDGNLIWVATQNGLQASVDLGRSWFAYDTTSGLSANGVYSLAGYTSFSEDDTTSFLCVGVYSGEKEYELPLLPSLTGEGFNYTSDYGVIWDTSRPGQATEEKFAYGIAIADTVIWSACGRGGLIRSFDRGKTWENVFVDTSAKRRYEEGLLELKDEFLCVAVDTSALPATTIWAGTANGLYKFVYTATDSGDTVIYFLEGSELYPNSVLSLGIQKYDQNKIIWASVCPKGVGVPSCSTYKSTDGGETWTSYLGGVWVRDLASLNSTVWAATDQGLKRTTDGGIYWETFEILDTVGQAIIPSNFTSVCVIDSTIWAGTVDGLAKSEDDGLTWEVTKFAHSFKKAIWAGSAAGIYKFIYNYRDVFDTVLNYSYVSHNITGNWVVSLAIQEYDGKKIMWAGTQPTYYGENGASFSTDDGATWDTTLSGDRVWNFAFDDHVIWTATSSGLKRSNDWGKDWDVFNFMEDKDEISKKKISSSEFTSVAIIDGEVWAGNVDGLVKSQDNGNSWDVIRTAVPIGTPGSETAYAYPSPFSPILEGGQVVRIRYRPRQDGPVTIKIYDFAMNLVKTLVYEKSVAEKDQEIEWDGKNDREDIVANGVYFFKVEAPGGQIEWGKLVILK